LLNFSCRLSSCWIIYKKHFKPDFFNIFFQITPIYPTISPPQTSIHSILPTTKGPLDLFVVCLATKNRTLLRPVSIHHFIFLLTLKYSVHILLLRSESRLSSMDTSLLLVLVLPVVLPSFSFFQQIHSLFS